MIDNTIKKSQIFWQVARFVQLIVYTFIMIWFVPLFQHANHDKDCTIFYRSQWGEECLEYTLHNMSMFMFIVTIYIIINFVRFVDVMIQILNAKIDYGSIEIVDSK